MNTNWLHHLNKGYWVGLDWLFPPVCGGCGNPGTRWCAECQKKVQAIINPVCDACGLPQAYSGLCERCQQNLPFFKPLRSLAVFENPVQGALHRLKYRRDIGLGEALSNQLAGYILHRIPRSLLRGFCALAKSVPEGGKFRNTLSACGGDRNFEDFANLLAN